VERQNSAGNHPEKNRNVVESSSRGGRFGTTKRVSRVRKVAPPKAINERKGKVKKLLPGNTGPQQKKKNLVVWNFAID